MIESRASNVPIDKDRLLLCKSSFFSLIENIPISRISLPSLCWERRTVADASVAFLKDGEGEGDSVKSEMMVASFVKLRLRGGGVL